MKAHIVREFKHTPSPVLSIASNGITTIVFRKNQMIEFIDTETHSVFLRYDIGLAVKESYFIDSTTVVCLSQCGSIAILDTESLESAVLDLSATHISLTPSNAGFAERCFYFTTIRNELCEMKGGVTSVIRQERSHISALLCSKVGLILGTADGWARIYRDGQRIAEIELEGIPNQICDCGNGQFVAALSNGFAVLFDAENGVVFDRVEVRSSALNTAVFLDGFVHLSGEDSRIIAYSVASNRLSKITQADFHSAEVLAMAVEGTAVITGGEDTAVIFNTLLSGRYTSSRIYDCGVCTGTSAAHFYISDDYSINLFNIKEGLVGEPVIKEETAANKKITFKISPSVLEAASQKQTDLSFFLRFNTASPAIAVGISNDEKYLAYSTSKETILYNLFQGSNLRIEKIRTFGAAQQILFAENYLIIVEMRKSIVIVDLGSFETVAEIEFYNHRERVVCGDGKLILSHSKRMIDLSSIDDVFVLEIEEAIKGQLFQDGAFNLLLKEKSGGYSTAIVQDGKILKVPLKAGMSGNIYQTGENIFYNDRSVFIQEEDRLRKYDIGHVIYSVLQFQGSLIVFQTAWAFLKNKFKPSVFKPKFGNH